MNNVTISKSQFMEGQRCPKLFWLQRHKPDLAASPDQQSVHLFEIGHIIGRLARELYPSGVMIPMGSYDRLVTDTESALAKHSSFYYYEPAFEVEGLRCRLDILCCINGGNTWEIKEVKMCSRVKPENILDVAFQGFCVERAGYQVNRFSLIHVNNCYVHEGKIEPEKFLVEQDITAEVTAEILQVAGKVKNLRTMVESPEPPTIIIGAHCSAPGKCPYFELCHANIEEDSIYYLPNGTHKIPGLLESGITKLSDVPIDEGLTYRQSAAVKSSKQRTPVVDVPNIRLFLSKLRSPLFFLDFETVAPCIPVFDRSSPYEKIPFQYSLHVQAHEEKLQHFEFLPKEIEDPRYPLIKDLLGKLGESGSIIAWNMCFEKSVLKRLAEHYPEYREKISKLLGRFVDLIIPFKSGLYVDYRFCGSVSLKKVLPVLCPKLAYDDLQIRHGDDASQVYQQFVDGAISEWEWKRLCPEMLAYCERDTYGMVAILDNLYKIIFDYQLKEMKL